MKFQLSLLPLLISVVFIQSCKNKLTCDSKDSPPFTDDQLSWVQNNNLSAKFKAHYKDISGNWHTDTISATRPDHKGPNEEKLKSVNCEKSSKWYWANDEWLFKFTFGPTVDNIVTIENQGDFSVFIGLLNQTLTNDPRTDTITINGILFDHVYKGQNGNTKLYFSRTKGIIYCELPDSSKAEIIN